MYTLWEIDNIINVRGPKKRATRAKYAIKRIDETINTYKRMLIDWPALYQSMQRDKQRLQSVI